MAGVNKEIWTDVLLEGFIPDGAFLGRSRDLSEFVDYNTLHFAEAGADPKVLVNNTSFPVGTSQREDTPKEITLQTFDTENTVVRNIEEIESSYKKMESVIRSHRNALYKKCVGFAAHAWAPQANAAATPVWAAEGAANKYGYKSVTFDMLYDMAAHFQSEDVPADSLVMVLHPYMLADLYKADAKQYKDMFATRKLAGFDWYVSTATAKYNGTSGEKTAYGAVAADTDAVSALFYCDQEVARAMGSVEMFYKEKSPEQRGDIVGFQQRFIAAPMRGKYIGAIYCPKAE